MDEVPQEPVSESLRMSSDLYTLLQIEKMNEELVACIYRIKEAESLEVKLAGIREGKQQADDIEKMSSNIIDEKVLLRTKNIMYNVKFAQKLYADFEKHIK